jgi:hypothetical protein
VKPIAAKRLKMTMDIVIISSSHGRDWLTELGAWEKVEGQISRVFCCRLFAKARRERDGN